jgi:hypothetical protein
MYSLINPYYSFLYTELHFNSLKKKKVYQTLILQRAAKTASGEENAFSWSTSIPWKFLVQNAAQVKTRGFKTMHG